tara:strand:+ start:1455 stop:2564 length:1110 start_codon:yes stop_codon:yes gene_type:complete
MINKTTYDVVIIGAGIMGCTTALHLAKSGMKTLLIDRGKICREASGVNAGTLTIHMTRAQLIPYAIKGWEFWMNSKKWLGEEIEVTKAPGLCLAFSKEDEQLLVERSKARIEQGAPIKLISKKETLSLEPNVNPKVKMAAFCEMDGYVNSYKTGLVFSKQFRKLGVNLIENEKIVMIENDGSSFLIKSKKNNIIKANKIVLAGGVWLEEMLKWFNINIEVKCLPQQLIVTERIQATLKTVITIANGKLSMKQFSNGTTLIGGGWPGNRNINHDKFEHLPENLIGNMQLACHSIPSLKKSRVLRVWGGLEAETKDAMPIMDTIPQNANAFVIGSFHSGYTSGPYVGYLMSKIIQGQEKIHHDLFSLSRLL